MNVWLSAGSYRFTANAGSPAAGAVMHLEVDGVLLFVPMLRCQIRAELIRLLLPTWALRVWGKVTTLFELYLKRQGFRWIGFMLRKDTDTTTAVSKCRTQSWSDPPPAEC